MFWNIALPLLSLPILILSGLCLTALSPTPPILLFLFCDVSNALYTLLIWWVIFGSTPPPSNHCLSDSLILHLRLPGVVTFCPKEAIFIVTGNLEEYEMNV